MFNFLLLYYALCIKHKLIKVLTQPRKHKFVAVVVVERALSERRFWNLCAFLKV